MLVNSKKMLMDARNDYNVIYHFNINNLEWAKIILEKCNNMHTPVILGASLGAIKYMGGFHVVSNLVNSLIDDLGITIPVCLHLDHGDNFESCKKAIDAGACKYLNFIAIILSTSSFFSSLVGRLSNIPPSTN